MDEIRLTQYPGIAKPNRYGLPDAAHLQIVLPETLTILAPGPKGKPFWLKADRTIIAVNSAIKISLLVDFWMVADGNAPKTEWFKWGCEEILSVRKLFSEAIYQESDYRGDYTFWFYPMVFESDEKTVEFMNLPYRVDPDFFRPTESVTGIAIDFAVRYGAKEINLIGVDMEGGYFDDPPDLKRDVINDYVFRSLQKEINYFKAQGIKFRALSPTRLEI